MAVTGIPSIGIVDSTALGRALVVAASASAARSQLALDTTDSPTFAGLTVPSITAAASNQCRIDFVTISTIDFVTSNAVRNRISNGSFSITDNLRFGPSAAAPVTFLHGNTANTLDQRNATNPQTYNLYNTYTDDSNYERTTLSFSGNKFNIHAEASGTGTARQIDIVGGSALTMGAGGVRALTIYGDSNLNVTGAVIATGSTISQAAQASGNTNRGSTTNNGMVITSPYVANQYWPGVVWATDDLAIPKVGIQGRMTATGSYMYLLTSDNYAAGLNALERGITIAPNGQVGVGTVNPTAPLTIANVSGRSLDITNTYTDASNYERGFARFASNRFEIGTEAAGTGTKRAIQLSADAYVPEDVLSPNQGTFITGSKIGFTRSVDGFQNAWIERSSASGTHIVGFAFRSGSNTIAEFNYNSTIFAVIRSDAFTAPGGDGYFACSNIRAKDFSAPSNLALTFYSDDASGSDIGIKLNRSSRAAVGTKPIVSFRHDDVERVRITTAGMLGIGQATPTAPLHVKAPTTGNTALFEYLSGSAAISLQSNAASQSYLYFGDTVSYRGRVQYSNATDIMSLVAGLQTGAKVVAAGLEIPLTKDIKLFNLDTDASNYERGFARWSSNVFKIGTEAAGTGTARDLHLDAPNVQIGDATNATSMKLYSPDGTEWTASVDNTGNWVIV